MEDNFSSNGNANRSTISYLINDLYQQFHDYKLINDKKFENLNMTTSMQLGLINDRLSSLENNFQTLVQDITQRQGSVHLINDKIKKKIETIGQQIHDLSTDLNCLNSNNSNSSTHSPTNLTNSNLTNNNLTNNNLVNNNGPNTSDYHTNSNPGSSPSQLQSQSTNTNAITNPLQVQAIRAQQARRQSHIDAAQAQVEVAKAQVAQAVQAQQQAEAEVQAVQAEAQAVQQAEAARVVQAAQAAQVQASQVQAAQLQDAQLQDAQLQSTQPQLQNPQLQNAQLQNAQLQNPQLQNPQLQNAQLQHPQLQNTQLQNQLQNAPPQTFAPMPYNNIPSVESSNSSASMAMDQMANSGSVPSMDPNSNYNDNSLIDINKQWSKALGIKSPDISSPFTPSKLTNLEFPIPINRAISFNRQFNDLEGNGSSLKNEAMVSSDLLNGDVLNSRVDGSDTTNMTGQSGRSGGEQEGRRISNAGHRNHETTTNIVGTHIDGISNDNNADGNNTGNNGDPLLSLATDPNFNILNTTNSLTNELLKEDPPMKKRRSSKSTNSEGKSPTHHSNKKIPEAPQFKLEKGARNVSEIWEEYEHGINGKPPLKALELKYNAKWRNETESRTFVRRKKIYHAIEIGKEKGYNEHDIIKELEDSRNYFSNGTAKKRPLSWLYSNIPEKYQN